MTRRRIGPRKDRLIQTRVPQDLETTLKDEARKRRLSVSHLIRNVLEDTFDLVDNVVEEVDRVVADSHRVAQTLRGGAERLRATARGEGRDTADAPHGVDGGSVQSDPPPSEAPPATPEAEDPPADLSHVYAWQPVVLNRAGECARCHEAIGKGEQGHMGLSDAPGPRAWLCDSCVDAL